MFAQVSHAVSSRSGDSARGIAFEFAGARIKLENAFQNLALIKRDEPIVLAATDRTELRGNAAFGSIGGAPEAFVNTHDRIGRHFRRGNIAN